MICQIFSALIDSLEIEKPPVRSPYWAMAMSIRNMLKICPVCGGSLDGHTWAEVADAGNRDDMKRLLDSLKAHDWQALRSIHSFVGTKNAIVSIGVRCGDRGAVLAYVDYDDLWFDPQVAESCRLDEAEWKDLLDRVPDVVWRPFD